MLSIRGRIYNKALAFMMGYDLSKCREMLKPDKINDVEKKLGLWPYINEIRKLVNKHVLKKDEIKEEDVKAFSMLRYDSLMGALWSLYYNQRNEYYNSIVEAMKEFHDGFVLKTKYTGLVSANKMFNNRVKFNELPYNDFLKEFTIFSCFFDALAMSQFVNLKGFNEANTPNDELLVVLERHFSKKNDDLDLDAITAKYKRMTSSELKAKGYAVNVTNDGIRLACPNDIDTIIIPAYVDGKEIYEVSSITESLSNKTKVRTLVILGNVKVLSKFLTNAPYLSKIILCGNINEIVDDSFISSVKLHKTENGGTYLNINDNPYYALLTIDDDIASFKVNRKTVVIAYHAGYKKNIKSLDLANVLYISRDAFYECETINIDLPNKLKYLGNNAFYGCRKARFLDLGFGIKRIPPFAFSQLESVTELILHENIEFIDILAFSGLKSLEKLTICNDRINISTDAFNGSNEEFEIYSSDDIYQRIGLVAGVFNSFECSWYDIDLDKLQLLKNSYEIVDLDVEEANEIGFDIRENDDARSLVSTNVPLKVKEFICPPVCEGKPIEIVTCFFNKSSSIEKLYFPNDVYFDWQSLNDCPNLEEIIVDGDIKQVDSASFKNCDKLKNIYNGVVYININNNPYYIASCLAPSYPKNITLHPNCKFVQNGAFGETDIESIDFANVETIGEDTISYCEKLKKVTMSDTVKLVLGNLVFNTQNVEYLKLSDNIENIDGTLICGNNKLREIKLPSKLKCVGSYFIEDVTLIKEITFGKNTKEYGWSVICDCPNVKKVRVPKGSQYDPSEFDGIKVEEY